MQEMKRELPAAAWPRRRIECRVCSLSKAGRAAIAGTLYETARSTIGRELLDHSHAAAVGPQSANTFGHGAGQIVKVQKEILHAKQATELGRNGSHQLVGKEVERVDGR
jgi:hypothetical protein